MPAIRLSKTLETAVMLANACTRHKLNPRDMAELVALCDRAFRAGERECSYPDSDASKPRRRVEKHAETMGLAVQWPGLWPHFTTAAGKEVTIPSAD